MSDADKIANLELWRKIDAIRVEAEGRLRAFIEAHPDVDAAEISGFANGMGAAGWYASVWFHGVSEPSPFMGWTSRPKSSESFNDF